MYRVNVSLGSDCSILSFFISYSHNLSTFASSLWLSISSVASCRAAISVSGSGSLYAVPRGVSGGLDSMSATALALPLLNLMSFVKLLIFHNLVLGYWVIGLWYR